MEKLAASVATNLTYVLLVIKFLKYQIAADLHSGLGCTNNELRQSNLMIIEDNWSLLSSQLSYVMAGCRYFVCPVEFNNDSNSFQVDCEPPELFQLQDYALPSILESVTGWVRLSL